MTRSTMTKLTPALLVLSVVAGGCSPGAPPPPAAATATVKIPLADMPKIEAPQILEHIRKLASDEFEGRKPGTPGEDRTVGT